MARFLSRSAPALPHAGTRLSEARELCATRLHNRSPAHPAFLPALLIPALSSSPPASVPVSLAAVGARESTSGNMPFFWIPGSAARGTRQKISGSPAASIARPALRTDIVPVPQTWYLSPFPCAAPRPRSHRFWLARTRLAGD